MREVISGTVAGLRGPGLTEADRAALDVSVDAATAAANSAFTGAANALAAAGDSADGASQADAALVAIQAALAGFPNGATLTAPIATRILLANAIVSFPGNTAYLSERGREGQFVFDASDLAAEVATDPRQGVYVAPATDPSGHSGAWVRRYHRGRIEVDWFGAVADGVEHPDGTATGTDSTAAFQAAVNFAAANGGAEIRCGDGIYIIAGAPKGEGQCQISFPDGGDQEDQLLVRISGCSPPSTTWATKRGTIIRSTWSGVGDTQVFGGKTPSRGGAFEPHNHAVWCGVYLSDLTVRLNPNPTNTGIDLSYVPMFRLDNVRVDVANLAVPLPSHLARFTAPEPTTVTSYGIKGAVNDLPLRGLFYNVLAAGFYTGVRLGELWGGNDLTVLACKWALEVPNQRHGGSMQYILVCNCPNTIRVTANEPATFVVDYLDIEHDSNEAGHSGPDWVLPFGWDIYDPDSMLTGFVRFHMHDVTIPFAVEGGKNLRIVDSSQERRYNDWRMPRLFSGFESLEAAAHVTQRGVVANNASGTAWNILATNQPGLANLIGSYVFANTAIADGQNKRIAAIYARTDGDLDSGRMSLATAKNGNFRPVWDITKDGDLVRMESDSKLLSGAGSNGDMWGVVSTGTSPKAVKMFARAFNNPPAVIVSPGVDLPATVQWRVARFADRFEILVADSTGTPAAVTASFSYFVMGNPD